MHKRSKERPILPERITIPQFAEMAGCAVKTLKTRLAKDGDDAPQPAPGGGILVRYFRAEAEAWIRYGRAWRAIGTSAPAPAAARAAA